MNQTLLDIKGLRERARRGDVAAADEFEERFGPALQRIVRRKLDRGEVRQMQQAKRASHGCGAIQRHDPNVVQRAAQRIGNILLHGWLARQLSMLAGTGGTGAAQARQTNRYSPDTALV